MEQINTNTIDIIIEQLYSNVNSNTTDLTNFESLCTDYLVQIQIANQKRIDIRLFRTIKNAVKRLSLAKDLIAKKKMPEIRLQSLPKICSTPFLPSRR